jgi:hypothetical protein
MEASVYEVKMEGPVEDLSLIAEVVNLVDENKKFLRKMLALSPKERLKSITFRLLVKHKNMLALRQRLARDVELRASLSGSLEKEHGGEFVAGVIEMLIH